MNINELSVNGDIGFKAELSRYLGERCRTVICLRSAGSTNTMLFELNANGAADGQTLIADEQTAGRGRLGRAFASPAGRGIYLSMLMKPELPPSGLISLTPRAAVAAARAVKSVCGVSAGIKWVNDLVLNGRKLSGILTEASVDGGTGRVNGVVVGIGINITHDINDFPPELRDIATSLKIETGAEVSRARLAAEIITELDKIRASLSDENDVYLAEYRESCVTVGKEVSVVSGEVSRRGIALHINEDYSLTVSFADGKTENIAAGEVSVRGMYGYV